MTTENYTIRRRPGWGADIIVPIECAPDASEAVKLGLAAKTANLSGADLSRADLSRADLSGADLSRADLSGADLSGADLSGAKIHGEDITRLLAAAMRLDGYTFFAFELQAGGVKIMAGCRWFTIPQFCAHIAAEYPDTDKATETLQILDFLEDRAKAQGAMTAEQVETVEA